ncbi:MAG: amidohydrolase family protein, partial [Atopobiaceae bacterium]|nr:amidohydrolase family protein [Atopobiaceae bacterium]
RVCIAHSTCAETAALLDEPPARGEFELETCPHYLAFTSEKLAGPEGARYTMVPPLRAEADREALWEAILSGKLKILSTDHCPYHACYKDGATYRTIPNGVDGVQWRMIYAFSEGVMERGLGMPAFVDLTSANAARFYGMWPRKGCIAPGSDADLVLIDPAGTTVLGMGESASAIDYSIYEGMEMSGRIARVFKGGRQVYDGERVCAEPGSGRFLAR